MTPRQSTRSPLSTRDAVRPQRFHHGQLWGGDSFGGACRLSCEFANATYTVRVPIPAMCQPAPADFHSGLRADRDPVPGLDVFMPRFPWACTSTAPHFFPSATCLRDHQANAHGAVGGNSLHGNSQRCVRKPPRDADPQVAAADVTPAGLSVPAPRRRCMRRESRLLRITRPSTLWVALRRLRCDPRPQPHRIDTRSVERRVDGTPAHAFRRPRRRSGRPAS